MLHVVDPHNRFQSVFLNWLSFQTVVQGSRWTWASYTEDPRDLDAFVDGRLELASRKWLLVLLFYARCPVGTLCTFPGCYFLTSRSLSKENSRQWQRPIISQSAPSSTAISSLISRGHSLSRSSSLKPCRDKISSKVGPFSLVIGLIVAIFII